jgi:hypothetical protein
MAHAVPEDGEPGREQAACVYGLAGGVGAAEAAPLVGEGAP